GDHRPYRTKSIEAFGPSPLTVLFLQIPCSYIVHTSVAQDVGPNIFVLTQPITLFRDHYPEFALVVYATGAWWPSDLAAGSQQGRRRLQKDQRLSWNLIPQFGGVISVVASHANDLRRPHGSQQ